MTEKDKAEQTVRKLIPELKSITTTEYFQGYGDIQLQYWLRVLELWASPFDEYTFYFNFSTTGLLEARLYSNEKGEQRWTRSIYFSFTTGQPASEADYKAFNDIVGI